MEPVDEPGRIKVYCRVRPLGLIDGDGAGEAGGLGGRIGSDTDLLSRGSTPIEIDQRQIHVRAGGNAGHRSSSLSNGGAVRGGRRKDRWGFTFDDVMESNCGQDEVYYRCAHDIVSSVLQGINGTIMACEKLSRIVSWCGM